MENRKNSLVDEANGIHMLRQLSRKIDVLTESVNSLKLEIRNTGDKKETIKNEVLDIKNQNSLVLDILAENTAAIKTNLKNCVPKFTFKFPLKSAEDLKILENSINEGNEKEYISSIRAVCGNRGIKKGLSDIIKPDVLDKFNLEGTHNKMRLLQFPKFMSVLFCGTYNEGNSDKSFKIDLRDALKLAKNRHCKDKLKNLNKSADKENACDGKVHTTDPEEDFFLKNIIEC